MIKRLSVILVVSMFLTFIFAWGAFATVNKAKIGIRSTSSDAPAPENSMPPAPGKYMGGGLKYAGQCTDIAPEAGIIIEHTQIGDTWYDFQQSGSMGRMIAVTSYGYREASWMYTSAVYPGTGRNVRANCETPDTTWVGATNADGGSPFNSGYCNQSRLNGPGEDNGASVMIFHRIGGTPIWYTTLSVDDEVCGNFFTRKFDVPDYLVGSAYPMLWPKVEVKYDAAVSKDYIHVVGTEGKNPWGYPPKGQDDIPPNKYYYVPVMVAYERCYIKDGPALLDTLICQSFANGATQTYKVVAGANGGGSLSPISHFDSSCGITPVVVVSPVSRRIAIAYLKPACDGSCNYLSDICFIESMHSGDDWIAGSPWPPPEYYVTNYGCTGLERGFNEVTGCYDYQDSLHLVYITTNLNSSYSGRRDPHVARLYHWSKKTGSVLITSANHQGTNPDAHSCNIAKASISAQDPVYHPGGDSVYLYCIWTQFDSTDNADNGYSNGDIYGSGSDDGGSLWSGIFNLTNTQTPNCAPGACLSEHWSSLAQNMYNGDLHIQYVCDKDAGAAVVDWRSYWRDNPVMYLCLDPWPIDHFARVVYEIVDPLAWYDPPLKVTPTGTRNLTFKVFSIGNANLIYSVSSDDPCIQVSVPPTIVPPGYTETINATILGTGACIGTLIDGNIHIITNDTGNADIPLAVQAVVANDYFEYPRDSVTFDTLNNGVIEAYFTANSLQWMHDISTLPDTTYEIFFQGGPFVATTQSSDTLVGRYYGDNDARIVARAPLNLNSYADFWLEYSYFVDLQKFGPPLDTKWWWWELSHENVFFKSNASDDLKHTVIKFVTIERKDAPGWWPSHPTFTGYEDTYLGYMMDIDCPYDSLAGQNARNSAGYDVANNIAWQRGSTNPLDPTAHPQYSNYYCGIALIAGGQASESVVPTGTYNLANDGHLYPQFPWGWLEGDFYKIAKGTTVGAVEFPDSLKDRSQVITARKIPAGSTTNARASFTIVETFSAEAKSILGVQTRVAAARAWVAAKPFILCGDANNSGAVEVGDIVYLISYLYKNGPPPPEPIHRADPNFDGSIAVGDIVYLISYLYKSGPVPKCSGVW